MGSGINNKINEFICNPKNVKKTRNTRLEKCYGHVNIATAFRKTTYPLLFVSLRSNQMQCKFRSGRPPRNNMLSTPVYAAACMSQHLSIYFL